MNSENDKPFGDIDRGIDELSKESLKDLAIERGKKMQELQKDYNSAIQFAKFEKDIEIERLKGLLEKEVREKAFGIKEEDIWQQYKKDNQL